jgi:glucokinase
VIVNGPPGSGKSTLAPGIAAALGLPLLSKDAVKETLLDTVGYADRAASRALGAAAGEVVWTVLAGCPQGAVVDTWLAPHTRDIARAGLRRSGVTRAVEVWCHCDAEEITRRYADRSRHPGHFDTSLVPELAEVLAGGEPLGVTPVVRVRTDRPVDLDDLVRRILGALPCEDPGAPTD